MGEAARRSAESGSDAGRTGVRVGRKRARDRAGSVVIGTWSLVWPTGLPARLFFYTGKEDRDGEPDGLEPTGHGTGGWLGVGKRCSSPPCPGCQHCDHSRARCLFLRGDQTESFLTKGREELQERKNRDWGAMFSIHLSPRGPVPFPCARACAEAGPHRACNFCERTWPCRILVDSRRRGPFGL